MANHILHDLDGAGFGCLQLEELLDQEAAWRLLLNLKSALGQHQGQLHSQHNCEKPLWHEEAASF